MQLTLPGLKKGRELSVEKARRGKIEPADVPKDVLDTLNIGFITLTRMAINILMAHWWSGDLNRVSLSRFPMKAPGYPMDSTSTSRAGASAFASSTAWSGS